MSIKVYVLETGCYEDRYVAGVFGSLEAAQVAGTPSSATFRSTRGLSATRAFGETLPVAEFTWTPSHFETAEEKAFTPTLTQGFPILTKPPVFEGATGNEWVSNGDWEAAATISEYEVDVSGA